MDAFDRVDIPHQQRDRVVNDDPWRFTNGRAR
jgi:hypothetical protein